MSRGVAARVLHLRTRLGRSISPTLNRSLQRPGFHRPKCQGHDLSFCQQRSPNISSQIHHFSTSQLTFAVHVTNPREDDDGNAKVIDITSRASKVGASNQAFYGIDNTQRLSEIMVKDQNPDLVLRVTVESGGCHGFQYLMSLTSTDNISTEDDIIFEADDGTGAKVVMDEPSLDLLQGSKVDYTMELIGSQFKIVGNPKATSSCGCGTSFDIKI